MKAMAVLTSPAAIGALYVPSQLCPLAQSGAWKGSCRPELLQSGVCRTGLPLAPAQLHGQHGPGRRRLIHCAAMVSDVPVLESHHSSSEGEEEKVKNEELLACPICYEPLIRKGPPGLKQAALVRSGFECRRCGKAYSTRDVFLDLTVLSGASVYEEGQSIGTEMFRSPLVSFVYERGWRQNFERSGFPGPDEELKIALDFLKPTFGGVLVDVSCGSGLFTRRFSQSGLYSSVIALDFSENMLRQTSEFIKQDKSLSDANIGLVRADVGRLPFATGSIDAIHAGAAIHCWPVPSIAVAEISRVLKPGGVFVGSTFLQPSSLFKLPPLRQAFGLRQWDSAELRELCGLSGLVGYRKVTKGLFIMFTATKPLGYL